MGIVTLDTIAVFLPVFKLYSTMEAFLVIFECIFVAVRTRTMVFAEKLARVPGHIGRIWMKHLLCNRLVALQAVQLIVG